MAYQSSKLFLFLHENVTPLPLLSFTTKIENVNGSLNISHYLQPHLPSINSHHQITENNTLTPQIPKTSDMSINICPSSPHDNTAPSPTEIPQPIIKSDDDNPPLDINSHHVSIVKTNKTPATNNLQEKASPIMNTLLRHQKIKSEQSTLR